MAILASALLRRLRMEAAVSWNARRLVVLRDLLRRWIAELPAIKAADAERARAHEQGIADLRRMIEGIEREHGVYLIPAMTQSDSECATGDIPDLETAPS